MKKNKNELVRFQNLIECDRLHIGDEFFELLSVDLEKTLNEYFDLKGKIKIDVYKNNSTFNVEINFDALRLKTFGCVPEL